MYDIFFLGNTGPAWDTLQSIYPGAQRLAKHTPYDDICSRSFTQSFWVIWDDVILDATFNIRHYRPTQWDNMYIHVFQNGSHFDGICLFSKHIAVSALEFGNRLFDRKKEIPIVASVPAQYNRYSPHTFAEYAQIADDMFWLISSSVNIIDETVFDLYFSHHNTCDRRENHIFKTLYDNNAVWSSEVMLCSKYKPISKKEFKYRWLVDKKEHDLVISESRPYDIVFISYDEVHADLNYNKLIKKCPQTKRVHGITGIHAAHIKAAEMCTTDMIWIVDGDAVIEDSFDFKFRVPLYDRDCVYVWRSRNPVNDLEYGNGGVKLLPRRLTLTMNTTTTDMTTSISNNFKAMDEISNRTAFNTSEFATWRAAFRECVKLSSKIINGQCDSETDARLEAWCTKGSDQPYGQFAIDGAILGKQYGQENKNDPAALIKINDFDWVKRQFDSTAKSTKPHW